MKNTEPYLETTSRREFLKTTVASGLTLLCGTSLLSCLSACGDDNSVSADSDLTGEVVTLNLQNEPALQSINGFIRRSFGARANGGREVFVVRTGENEFKSASTICTHQPAQSNIQSPSATLVVECATHNSRYSLQPSNFGSRISGPAPRGLQTFVTTFNEGVITINF